MKSASVRNKVYELKSLAIPFNAKTYMATDNKAVWVDIVFSAIQANLNCVCV